MNENIKEMINKLESLLPEGTLKQITSPEKLVELAKSKGIEISPKGALEYLTEMAANNELLSGALGAVSGGLGNIDLEKGKDMLGSLLNQKDNEAGSSKNILDSVLNLTKPK